MTYRLLLVTSPTTTVLLLMCARLKAEFERIKQAVQEEFDWLYGTTCNECGSRATIQYTIWSDVFECGKCGKEIILWYTAVDLNSLQVLENFRCPHCNREWRKNDLKRLRSEPILTNYLCSKPKCGRHQRTITITELERLKELEAKAILYWYPTDEFPLGRQTRKLRRGKAGITHVHQLYTARNLRAYAHLWEEARRSNNSRITQALWFALTSINNYVCKKQNYFGGGGGITGTLYVSSFHQEKNVWEVFSRKLRKLVDLFEKPLPGGYSDIGKGSAAKLVRIPDNSIDYIFTDPPYGESLQYAEVNFVWESWLQQFTLWDEDCVMNYVHQKDLEFYARKMGQAFAEMHRVLKPNRWASVVFHNTDDQIWAAIQAAAQNAGFEVLTAVAFDKRQGTFNQVSMGRDNAAGFDIVLNLHKRPKTNGVARTSVDVDSIILDAIMVHLKTRPPVAHRTIQFLHSLTIRALLNTNVKVERVTIPYLEILLPQYGFKRVDGRWYLRSEHVTAVKLGTSIEDETTAIQWLHNYLQGRPQTRGEIDPHWKIATLNVRLSKDLDQILAENLWQDEMTGHWRIPTDEERAKMEDAARQIADRALRRLLNDLEFGRAVPSLPNSAALAQWVRYCAQHERWKDVCLLFPLLNRNDFPAEDWFELQNYHSFATQQKDNDDEASGRPRAGRRKPETARLPFDESKDQ